MSPHHVTNGAVSSELPPWLELQRAAVTVPVLPTSAAEIWRYSRIDELSLDAYPNAASPADVFRIEAPAGVRVRVGREVLETDRVGELVGHDDDAFSALALRSLADLTVIEIPANTVVDGIVRLDRRLTSDAAVLGSRLVVHAGENSDVTIIERISSDDVASLSLPITEVHLAPSARVRFFTVQELGPRMWQIGRFASRSERDATLSTMAVALGGSYARMRTDACAAERGAHNELLAVYFGEASQMHDFRTIQEHVAPRTTSELVFKGAVEDTARSVYSGLIRIGKDARGTVANQSNRNLLLSPDASAESVPNLEIENNDVKCSHASAIGPIDEDHRYYLESRGVRPDIAERLIVIGFFSDLLDRVPDPSMRDQLVAAVAEKFERRSAR